MAIKKIVEVLIENEANDNDNNGSTALIYACSRGYKGHGYTEVVKLLIKRGTNVNDKDYDGCTALMIASMSRKK